MARIKAVFFDMGGTIIHGRDIPGLDEKCFANVARLLSSKGCKVDWKSVEESYNRARSLVRDRTNPLIEVDTLDVWTEVLRLLGIEGDRGLAKDCMDAFFKPRLGIGKEVYFPDAEPTLAELKRRGFKLGLISNVGRGITYFLDELGFERYFDAIVFSWQTRWKKPSPKIFRVALGMLKVEPGESMMVGDSLEADVRGGQGVGMVGVWINRRGLEVDWDRLGFRPDYVVTSLTEILDILEELNKD